MEKNKEKKETKKIKYEKPKAVKYDQIKKVRSY